MRVEAIKNYEDAELGRDIIEGEQWEVPTERAIKLLNAHVCKIIDMGLDLTKYAYMSDSDLMELAKEKEIDGRIKDRKTIIDKINE